MKILITTDLYKPLINGVVTSVLNLKKGLEDQGHEVRVLTLSQTVHSQRVGEVYYVASIGTGGIYPGTRMSLRMPGSMFKEIVAWKPDIVHSQCELSTFRFAKKIAHKCDVPLIHTYHTLYENYMHYLRPLGIIGKKILPKLSRVVLNNTDRVIVPTTKVENILSQYGVSVPVTVIPSGIDCEKLSRKPSVEWIEKKKKEYGIQGNCLCLLYVGRLAVEKNVSELIEMMVDHWDLPIKLLVVGDGPDRKKLERRCKDLKVSDRVVFAGMVSTEEVWKYYHLGDVFVNASTSETQGLTNAEAMAAGLPMLCRSDKALDKLIINGVNGWQYENENEFRRLVELLRSDESLRYRMAMNSACEARKLSVKQFANKIIKSYA